MICDLCGSCHTTGKCHLHVLHTPKGLDDVHLAYKSLPSWIQVTQGPNGKTSVTTHRRLSKYTKLGPLLTPQAPTLVSNQFFPLKVFHNGGGVTYMDLSKKQYCNWLSLIPQGTAENKNLYVCQIEDFLYYFATEDIAERTELRVWYAPFYHEKILEDLNFLRGDKTLKALPVDKPHSSYISLTEAGLKTPSLTRISVGKGEVTFTHNICHYDVNHELNSTSTSVISDPSSSIWDGFIHAAGVSCRYVNKDQISERPEDYRKPVGNSVSCDVPPTIEVISEKVNTGEPEKVVTFTINTASKGQSPNHFFSEQSLAEELSLEEESDDEDKKKYLPKRKPYTPRKVKPNVLTAKSDVVRQLPPRALGVSLPRPWCCRYCGENFSNPLLFANHVKAHLRWIIFQKHKNDESGKTSQESLALQDHRNMSRKDSGVLENKDKPAISVKSEILSDEEAMDIENNENGQIRRKMPLLSTNTISGPHNCQICPTKFLKAEYLLRHLRKHTGDFTCEKCLKVFARKEGLQKHICPEGLHKKTLECPFCNRSFLSETLLRKHELKHEGSKKCIRCGRFYSNMESLEKHMRNCPTVDVTVSFQCGLCSREFVNQSLLDQHIAGHNQQYYCEYCNKKYSSKASLKTHGQFCRQIHQVMSYGHVKCEECGEVITNQEKFRIHYQKHTHPFICSGCNQRFKTRVGYEIHVCRVELNCDRCSAEFRSIQALNRHAAVHGPQPFTCMTCRRSFYRKESLDRHNCCTEEETKEVPHSKGNFNFKCNICGAILSTRHSFNTHMKAAHGGSAAKVHSCDICGKQFSRKDLLKEHSVVHTPASHPCPKCKKLFKSKKSLDVHSLIHQGIKRFVCKYCGKKYHQKVNLAKHERSHLPRGAVKCQCCGIQFYSTDDLKAHLLSHTLVQSELSLKVEKEPDIPTEGDSLHVDGSEVCINASEVDSSQTLKMKHVVSTDAKPRVMASTANVMDTGRTFINPNVTQYENSAQSSPKRPCVVVDSGVKRNSSLGLIHVADLTRPEVNIEVEKKRVALTTVKGSNVSIHASKASLSDKVPIESYQKLSKRLPNVDTSQNESSYSDMCRGTDNMPVNSASHITVNSPMQTYHLNLDDNCQVTVEKGHENFGNSACVTYEGGNKESNISLKDTSTLVENVSDYNSNAKSLPAGKSHSYQIVDQQIPENVVIVSDTHGDITGT